MDGTRHRRLRQLFDAAMSRESTARGRYLAEACADDPTLRSDVLRLLAAHDRAGSFLQDPASLVDGLGLTPADDEFTGTERFAVVRRLGSGGMGVVYEVEDRQRGETVALKTLRRLSGPGLYRIKQEFRRLADVSHPNIVCLHELVVEEGRGFFTMELVRGLTFVDYARPQPDGLLVVDRLTAALGQLLLGVAALHRFGKLHRDIKPSNVLVTEEGRTVILDFGLIADLTDAAGAIDSVTAGTPAYLAPEVAAAGAPSEASDWYGVGATLYHALTGAAPSNASLIELLTRTPQGDRAQPAAIGKVPPVLDAICVGLLGRDPVRRMTGAEALRRLGADTSAPSLRASLDRAPFVGRRSQLDVLDAAFRGVIGGRPASICVHGPSGIGKTALIRAFVDRLRGTSAPIWLLGRCYEHESVPYKGVDGVVDTLSRYLASFSAEEIADLVPSDSAALSRLFPVMTQVKPFESVRRRQEPVLDPLVTRQQAFAALRELMQRLAEERTVVMFIDDLQWADADSVALLDELLSSPHAPRLLTLVCFRTEEIASKPFLQRLLQPGSRAGWCGLALAAMSDDEAAELIDATVQHSSLGADQKRAIVQEAGGNAFFLEQLAHYAVRDDKGQSLRPTFAQMLDARLRSLPSGTRQFLEALAVCGRPMEPEVLRAATDQGPDTRSLVATLRHAHWVRSSGSADSIEPYHDRIREALVASLSSDAVHRIHTRMAQVLVARHSDDAVALCEHLRGAGDRRGASIQAGLAASKAGDVLAFDRAAMYYRHAIELAPDSPEVPRWKEGLATSLGNAGRPAEAAAAFLDAANDASAVQRIELTRRGAEQFLIGGHIDRGIDTIREVLRAVDIGPLREPRLSILSRAWNLARRRLRGLHFVRRDADDIPPEVLLRVDTSWSVMRGLAMVDMIAAADFSARHLRLALAAGEPARVVRAMVTESAWIRSSGQRLSALERAALSKAAAAAPGLGPQFMALCELVEGLVGVALGEWKEASSRSGRALTILRERCVDVAWELNTAQQFHLGALLYQGEIAEVSRQLPTVLARARSSGNLFLETELCTRMNLVWLAADRVDEGERLIDESMARWPRSAFYRQHHSALLARVQTALYRGDGEAALRLVSDSWPGYRRSQLLRVQTLRIEAWYLRARSALAVAAARHDARPFLRVARRAARKLAAETAPWSQALALLVNACIACREERAATAARQFTEAVERFERADMKLYSAVARRRLARLLGGTAGAGLTHEADDWMASQGIRNIDAMTRMLAP